VKGKRRRCAVLLLLVPLRKRGRLGETTASTAEAVATIRRATHQTAGRDRSVPSFTGSPVWRRPCHLRFVGREPVYVRGVSLRVAGSRPWRQTFRAPRGAGLIEGRAEMAFRVEEVEAALIQSSAAACRPHCARAGDVRGVRRAVLPLGAQEIWPGAAPVTCAARRCQSGISLATHPQLSQRACL